MTGDLIEELIALLQQLSFPIDLKSLAEVERQITEKIGADYFGALSHGSFLQFVSKHPPVMSALGGSTIGSNTAAAGGGSGRREQILCFVNQIKDKSDHVSYTICDRGIVIHVHVYSMYMNNYMHSHV